MAKQGSPDAELKPFQLPLNGKWKPVFDGTQQQDGDFQTLTNMRYTEAPGIQSINGMTKINTTALPEPVSGHTLAIQSGYHYKKATPDETHVLVQGVHSTSSYVMDNTTAPPAQGDFSATAKWNDAAGAGIGRFSEVPDGCVAYTNSKETCIWGGNEFRVGSFLIGDSAADNTKDFTTQVNNTLSTANDVATLSTGSSYLYIGSIRPIAGIKYYLGTVNANAATQAVKYWNGSAWTAVAAQVDGTIAVAGKTLSQTGTVSFTSTVSTAKPKVLNNQYLYWYQVTLTGLSAGVTVTYCTLDVPFQPLVDLWDGTPRGVQAYFANVSGVYAEETGKVFIKDYNSADPTTYANLSGITPSMYVVIGFGERVAAIEFGIVSGGGNTNSATMTVEYWNGTAWTSVGTLQDETSVGGATLAQPGYVSWQPPTEVQESTQSISNSYPWYYYKISFDNKLSDLVRLDYVFSIPIQQNLRAYQFVTTWQNRTVLIGEVDGKKNRILIGNYGSSVVFNGSDALQIDSLGDDSLPTAAGALFTRYTGSFYDTLVICKRNEVWVLDGTTISDYRLYKISDLYGCVAPETFRICPVAYEVAGGINRHIAIWQSATGVVMFDGNTINPVDGDIRDYFDVSKTECVKASLISSSVGFVDEREREYHLLIASGSSATGLNTEIVFNAKKKGWYKVERGLTLQCGFPVSDTYGGRYVYAGTTTGFLERLENGTDFDGTAIVSTFKTKDYVLAKGGWTEQTFVRFAKLMTRAKVTAGSLVLSHFGDTKTAADTKTLVGIPTSTTQRVYTLRDGVDWGANVFHSFQAAMTTTDVATPFEPTGIAGFSEDVRKDT